ncbi:MAG: hypothetical protein EAX89_10860 [Candidatus Lokiarchaeota archaeon]|nr:hypothetical protein [Candidatus Lokiarchaeota archaeon]
MSNNLKNLIDKAEQEERTHSELQKTIDKLNLEIANLKKKLEEHGTKSKTSLKGKSQSYELSQEIESLKQIIISQRDQLVAQELKSQELQIKLTNLTSELESKKSDIVNPVDVKVLSETKDALENILEDYGRLENENIKLSQNINDLEKKNNDLMDKLQKLENLKAEQQKIEQDYNILKSKSDQVIEQNKFLKNEISNLKSENASVLIYKEKLKDLTSQINQKISENQMLNNKIIHLNAENVNLKKYETMVSTLEAEVKSLNQQKDHIKEQDSILLAKTITAINAQERHKKELIKANTPTPPRKIEAVKIKEPILFTNSEKESKLKATNQLEIKSTNEKVELPKPQKSVQDLIAEEISNGTNSDVIKRKWECPKCGNIDKSKIREVPDKTRIIYGMLYAKKYKCGLCGNEWH